MLNMKLCEMMMLQRVSECLKSRPEFKLNKTELLVVCFIGG